MLAAVDEQRGAGHRPRPRQVDDGRGHVLRRARAPQHDKIHEVVDYDFVHATVRQRIAQGHINLQETLVDDIARGLLAHPAVRAVRVSSEKPDIYEDVAAVGVEVFHFKDPPTR